MRVTSAHSKFAQVPREAEEDPVIDNFPSRRHESASAIHSLARVTTIQRGFKLIEKAISMVVAVTAPELVLLKSDGLQRVVGG